MRQAEHLEPSAIPHPRPLRRANLRPLSGICLNSSANRCPAQLPEVVDAAPQLPVAAGRLFAARMMDLAASCFCLFCQKTGAALSPCRPLGFPPRAVSSLRFIRWPMVGLCGIRPRGGGASRIALRCRQSLLVAIINSQSVTSSAA